MLPGKGGFADQPTVLDRKRAKGTLVNREVVTCILFMLKPVYFMMEEAVGWFLDFDVMSVAG